MRTFGLIGKNLNHSWSKSFFDQKFKDEDLTGVSYENFQMPDLSGFRALIQDHPGLSGLNITYPYKEKIIAFLDRLDPEAEAIGAVNVIKIQRHGKIIHLEGFNTDAPAFLATLKPLLTAHDERAIVLGTGGASKAVQFTLGILNIGFINISRSQSPGHLTYDTLTRQSLSKYQIIINATPVGMHPETDVFPIIPYDALTPGHLLYDLVYNPEETLFLKKGREAGARIKNGLEMLYLQAEMSWQIWNS